MKQSQGLSINVIIILAIAMVVLVVLVGIFTGSIGMFTQLENSKYKIEETKIKATKYCEGLTQSDIVDKLEELKRKTVWKSINVKKLELADYNENGVVCKVTADFCWDDINTCLYGDFYTDPIYFNQTN
tara:strand:+ start:4371 stop:4757 length:387 start_codon:yes stop_codon:yes gene_type:complete